jgi:anti-sigma factor RsiW
MSCPDPPVLSQLLDGELAPSEATAIRLHVDGCPACRARLDGLERATAAARVAMAGDRAGPGAPPDTGCVAPDRLAGWAARALPPDDLRSVELHLETCATCLEHAREMIRWMTKLDAGPTLAVPAALERRVASRWTDAPQDESLTALVLGIARGGMTLLERQVVAPVLAIDELPAAAAVRAGEPTETFSFRIRAPEAQIRATVFSEGGALGLTLTLLGSDEDALGGQRVFLRRHGRSIYSARTDAAGALTMPGMKPGVYEVSCPGIGTSFRLDLRP